MTLSAFSKSGCKLAKARCRLFRARSNSTDGNLLSPEASKILGPHAHKIRTHILNSIRASVILGCTATSASAQQGSNALQSGTYDWCGNYSHPWRVTVCECSGSTDGRLYGDGIYKRGSNPCKAAAHSGLLDAEGKGTIAVEPHTGLSAFPASERNGIRSREARGGPAFVIRPVRTEQDVESERHRSAAKISGSANIAELAGFWKEGNFRYYFTGSTLINLQEVDGVRAFRHPRANTATWRVFPPGTALMQVTGGTEEHFVGYWLFEDLFWGRVEGEMISPSHFIDIDEVSEDGRMRRGAISLHRDNSLTFGEALNQYPEAFANAGIVDTTASSSSVFKTKPDDPADSPSEAFFSVLESNWTTLASWFLSFTNSPAQIGTATDALAIGNEFADAAEQFANSAKYLDQIIDEGFDTLHGGPVVLDQREFSLLENYVQRRLASKYGANPWAGFGLNASQFRRMIIENLDARGLKGW
ncbi:LCCL domain-containing protein [Ruegeria sp. HKCCD6228]|uniref:LCCL domain-containing protein n=1 Tax=Ruegeria sp. HKCCD6228 TaxID=2683001 RepID=UPI0021100124|nr:LCCL domain-containing protein [Ruegeria sp. HKCCD6228]